VLDGLEPLQHPPGPEEGRLREPSLQALLRELAAFNRGLCLITTRLAVADLVEHEGDSVVRRDLNHLSEEAGAQLLRALGIHGPEAELRRTSVEFGGHCLALTLLGSYLSDAYDGDIRRRTEVSTHLAHDVRQGAHARKVMGSYQSWFGEGPEVSTLRLLGLFDRPADDKALEALLRPLVIPGLTEALTGLSPAEWRTVLTRLRRARLLAGEDPHHPGQLDTHPLVREYFGEQLRSQRAEAWQEGNRRLYEHYRALAPPQPESVRAMEPLFLAVICACQAGFYREALHAIYLPRIQRGNACFAANVLGARGALLSVLAHFFEHGHWGSPTHTDVEGQNLTPEDQLFILIQSALYLTAARESAPEARLCYERAEALCHSLNRPLDLYVALMGQYRYTLMTGTLTATMRLVQRVYALAQEQNDPTLLVGAYTALAATLYYMGDLETARQYVKRGVELWRSGAVRSQFEEVDSQVVACLAHEGLFQWHFGEIASCRAAHAEAMALAKELNDAHGLAVALSFGAVRGYFDRNPAEVDRLAAELIELSTRHHFAHWLALGTVYRGWARSALGDPAESLVWIAEGIRDYQAIGSVRYMPFCLALKAEALHLAARTPEALEVVGEAEALVERFEGRWLSAELHRLRGVFLAALDADEAQIEAAFHQAIRTAQQQKSLSLRKRAEAGLAAYRGR
jgi:tetratricopeptide (TPR) repeat protein